MCAERHRSCRSSLTGIYPICTTCENLKRRTYTSFSRNHLLNLLGTAHIFLGDDTPQAGSRKKTNVFPGECPRRLFDSDRKCFAYALYVPFRRPHLSGGGLFLVFLSDFLPVKIFWKMWPTLDQTFSAKIKLKLSPPRKIRPRDGRVEHVCKISGTISQKRRGHLDVCT